MNVITILSFLLNSQCSILIILFVTLFLNKGYFTFLNKIYNYFKKLLNFNNFIYKTDELISNLIKMSKAFETTKHKVQCTKGKWKLLWISLPEGNNFEDFGIHFALYWFLGIVNTWKCLILDIKLYFIKTWWETLKALCWHN